jgi:ketosteroid isomerase-like protein
MTMDDRAAVLAANNAFYRAFESLDLARMEAVWLRAPHVKCVHPGWGLLAGWGPVMESWRRIFADALEMRFTLAEVAVEVVGDLAWVVATEHIASSDRDGRSTGIVQATNVFQRAEGRWLVIHHHGSPVLAPLVPGGERLH